ncbi:MAG: hypothetical protein GYB68_15535, partial [Chloroflexi bacterium]|nr:hypothetical protein [Chloroflexota bacterium]
MTFERLITLSLLLGLVACQGTPPAPVANTAEPTQPAATATVTPISDEACLLYTS